jgi:hypothetical protein
MKRAHALRAFVVLMLAASCDDKPTSHVYVAQLYEPARDCLDPSTSIDIVSSGDGPLSCAPACLVAPSPPAPNSAKVYVSTMCAPYPASLDTSGTDETCAAALAAFARADVCASDGTSSSPADGGAEDASDDASDDGSTDDGDDGGENDAETDARDATRDTSAD